MRNHQTICIVITCDPLSFIMKLKHRSQFYKKENAFFFKLFNQKEIQNSKEVKMCRIIKHYSNSNNRLKITG